MTRGVDGVGACVDEELRFPSVEGSDEDRVELALRAGQVASRKEEEASPVWKEPRPAMRRFVPRGVEPGHRYRLSSGRGHAMERFPERRLEKNCPVATPAPSARIRSIADRERRTA